MAIDFWFVGEKVPLVTLPTISPLEQTAYPSRAIRRPSSSSPTRTGLSEFFCKRASLPTEFFFPFHSPPQTCLDGIDRLQEFMAIERHSRLEPERVPGRRRPAGRTPDSRPESTSFAHTETIVSGEAISSTPSSPV